MKGGDALIIAVVLFFALWLALASRGRAGWAGAHCGLEGTGDCHQARRSRRIRLFLKLSRGEVNIEIRKGRVRLRTTAGLSVPGNLQPYRLDC